MQVRGCGHGGLDCRFCMPKRESDFVGDDRPGAPHLPRGERRGADARDIAGVVALQVHVADRVGADEPLDLAHEPEAPRLAAELAVGDHLQPEALLPANGLRDESIRRLALQDFFGAQQAADVLGVERRTAQANSSMRIGQRNITIDFAANRGAPCSLFLRHQKTAFLRVDSPKPVPRCRRGPSGRALG